ncbi:CopG family transcriptional regulator [Ramlibacter sp. MMS24-I3-19]|uniref:CopG family transcriptional regulator n=1 Tax=Ramlibacter sp. MMS24-I3-19 TaxID=3416606 RepID=UPI003D03EF49
MDNKTARLTVLVDPARKAAFEKLCHSQDMTPSQVLRRLIREFMDMHTPTPGGGRQPRKRGA